jgi:hypothetical protein
MRGRRAALVAALGALLVVPGAAAAISRPAAPPEPPRLTEALATKTFLAKPKVASWTGHYERDALVTRATFDRRYRDWDVDVWAGPAGQVATGRVDDLTGVVTEAWTGPQVAWTMARGRDGSFGGKALNAIPVWLCFCAAFLLGLADWRRPLSVRNLDLLVLLSFSVSLWFFNDGRIFSSASLAYPPLVYLLARMIWAGARGRSGAASRPVWPVWALVAGTIFLAGFRVGLQIRDSRVIDVGYAGAIGAQRIADGESPYGHMPREQGRSCAPADRSGRTVYRIQTNGRCESANERGDTYGPVSYQAYLPGYALFGWKGKGDDLDAARFTSTVFDTLCLLGLALVGLRFGGRRLAAVLPFAWASYPFTLYAMTSNTNDAIQPALLIWGFWLSTSPWARGILAGLAGWTKFGALLVAPLWATYPDARRLRPALAFAAAFLAATLAGFWILLLEPDPLHAARVFWDRTLGWQIGRSSPFSIWDWARYRAGLPDLRVLQIVLSVLVGIGAVAVAFVPRRKSPFQLAALTAACLLGFELVLTHWFYLYIPWFFPFVAFCALAPAAAAVSEPVLEEAPEAGGHRARNLVPAG